MIIKLDVMHATGGPGNSRPQRYLRLARMRFDSLTLSAGPAINWSVEAPFFNRFLCCCRHSAELHSLVSVSAEDVDSITNSIKAYAICALQGCRLHSITTAGRRGQPAHHQPASGASMPVHAKHDSAATAPSPLYVWHIRVTGFSCVQTGTDPHTGLDG